MQTVAYWQFLTVVAIPTLMVFAGILMNRQDFIRLEGRTGQHFIRLEEKSDKRAAQLHRDMMMSNSVLRDHEGRISRLESQ